MPTEWKLVPVTPTDEMVVAFAEAWYSKRQTIDDPDMLDAYRSMLLVAPQPPALGGEPEVMAFLHSSDGYMNERWVDLRRDNACNPRAMILQDHHRSHVAQLQAEVSQLRQHKNDYMEAAEETRKALQAEVERLRGIQPEFPPRPPDGEGLPRFGLRWNGPQQPLATPMDDGYWTPWHLAHELSLDAARYRHLRAGTGELKIVRFTDSLDTCSILTGDDADAAIDAELSQQ